MKHITVIDSDTGGFVLADSGSVNYDSCLAKALNVIFDPDGETNATAEYPGRAWQEVVKEARAAAKAVVDDCLAVVLAAEGYAYITVHHEELTGREKSMVHETKRMRLNVPSGSITLADGMFLFDEDGRDAYELEEIAVKPGLYDVTVYSLNPDPEVVPTVGVFGDEESPAFIVQLTPAAEIDSRPTDIRFDMSQWTRTPVSGAICAVTVNKISGDEAHADIHLTSHVTSGKARFSIPEGVRVAVGDEPWVLLERDAGKYWTASLIEES